MSSVLVPLHLGSLHPYETALLALLAFGPFVVLAFVVVVMRRRDVEEAEAEDGAADEAQAPMSASSGRDGSAG
jgi:hypothetical protein